MNETPDLEPISYIWVFFAEDESAGAASAVDKKPIVAEKASPLHEGHLTSIAAAIHRTPYLHGLDPDTTKQPDDYDNPLLTKVYNSTSLASWPPGSRLQRKLAKGVCRYSANHRLQFTGDRWSLAESMTILKVRAPRFPGNNLSPLLSSCLNK